MQPTSRPQHSYPGGKAGAGVYQKLINLMPPHTVYIEPFLGHGAVLLHKRPAPINIGLDLDPRAVREVRARLTAAIAQDDAEGSRAHQSDDAAAAALRTPRQSAMACSSSEMDEALGFALTSGPARFEVLVGDALAFLNTYRFTGSELLYCDPPYVLSSRRDKGR